MAKNQLFDVVKVKRPNRNVFDLSHEFKFTGDFFNLVPILCQDVVPGDQFRVRSEVFLRTQALLSPMMHRCNVYTHYFFVPNRLIWSDWEKFITGGEDGEDVPLYPTLNMPLIASALPLQGQGSLSDYLGFPPFGIGNTATRTLDALPFRAYQLIYNEYYRDQNLDDPIDIQKNVSGSSGQFGPLMTLRKRCWEKDYFTSALPWAQRGPDVRLPIQGDAPVYLNEAKVGSTTSYPKFKDFQGVPAAGSAGFGTGGAGRDGGISDQAGTTQWMDPNGTLRAALSESDSATINELRRCFRLQEWLEKNARGGSRYVEQILSHFGVRSSDARLQRPEYLGGGKSTLVISEVMQNAPGDAGQTPLGNLGGKAISVGNTNTFSKFFEEHGYVIAIMSVVPRSGYMNGVDRKYLRRDRFDYFFPEFAHLGEQGIMNEELYARDDDYELENSEIFGYTPRYAEYKYCPDRVSGQFRSTLDYWHMCRKFSGMPSLSSEFVHGSPANVDRVFAVRDTDSLLVDVYHDIKAVRPMPKFGTPTF